MLSIPEGSPSELDSQHPPQVPIRSQRLPGSPSYLSDGVGGATVGDLSGARAVGGHGSDDLSGVGNVLPSGGASGDSEDSSNGVLHLD